MRSRLAMLALGLTALCCGGSSGSGAPGGSTPIAQADACQAAATAACTKIYSCSDTALAFLQVILMSEPMCETTVLNNCGATGFQCSAVQTYHADQAGQCRDAFNGEACASLAAAVMAGGASTSAVLASLTASLPGCSQICTGGTAADAAATGD